MINTLFLERSMSTPFEYVQEHPERTKSILGIDNNQLKELLAKAELLQNRIRKRS